MYGCVDTLDALTQIESECLSGHPVALAFIAKVSSLGGIKEYLATRRKSDFAPST
jgi:hypothetical protein